MSAARLLAALALLAAAAPADNAAPTDPCRAATAPLPRADGVAKDAARAVEAYRISWRRACDPKATVDVAALLGDAEALAADARMSRSVRALSAASLGARAAWPLPGIRPLDGDVAVDWAAFAPLASRGTVNDVRFWRGATVAADGLGEPGWLQVAPEAAAGVCVRLGETRWIDVARAVDDMEAAEAPQYAGHARELRALLLDTLERVAKGPEVCGCLRGDAVAGLAGLASEGPDARRGTAEQRSLSRAAGNAVEALRSGRVKVRWLRDAAGAEPTGCSAPP